MNYNCTNGFKSKTPLQDRAVELGMDIITRCGNTLDLNKMLIEYNTELDDLRGKRHIAIHNLSRITARETQIDVLQDAIHERINELQTQNKEAAREANTIAEHTKDILQHSVLNNCTVNIK
ncbi:MAG: hypothetical protein AB2L14_25500 [Candidatus Xenobiia bacterium LiM19]